MKKKKKLKKKSPKATGTPQIYGWQSANAARCGITDKYISSDQKPANPDDERRNKSERLITANTPPKTQPFSPRKSLGVPSPDQNLLKREKSQTLNRSKKSQPKNSDVNEPNRKLESAKKLKTTKYAAHGDLKKELQHRQDLIESNLTKEDHVLKSQLS